MQQYQLTDSGLSSMILLENNKVYRKSTAALRIARGLPMPWPLLFAFTLVPEFIRDRLYDLIGKHRYRLFGKYDSCWIPDDESRKKFID